MLNKYSKKVEKLLEEESICYRISPLIVYLGLFTQNYSMSKGGLLVFEFTSF